MPNSHDGFLLAVEYQKGEDPRLLKSGKHAPVSTGAKTCLALSPDGDSFAVSTGSDLYLYVVNSGKLLATIKDVYNGTLSQPWLDPSSVFSARPFYNVV